MKIRFDGWPDCYSYWVDDDSPDIHPAGWCAKTGHPLEPPLSKLLHPASCTTECILICEMLLTYIIIDIAPENLNDRPECGTYGCRGIGNVKGPKYATHNSASGCPYSPQNLNKTGQMPDRLSLAKYEAYDFEDEISNKLEKTEKKVDKNSKSLFSEDRVIINEKEIKQEDTGDLSDKNDKSENRSEHSEKYVKYNI